MVTRFGMSQALGHLTYGKAFGSKYLPSWTSEDRNYSERTAQEIDDEVRRIGKECHDRARSILSNHRDSLDRVALALIEKETLSGDALRELLSPVLHRVRA